MAMGDFRVTSLRPSAPEPRSGSMLVFVHVSSMNTKRLGSIPLWRFSIAAAAAPRQVDRARWRRRFFLKLSFSA